MIEVREYVYSGDRGPFGDSFNGLDAIAAPKVTVALERTLCRLQETSRRMCRPESGAIRNSDGLC